MKRQEFDRALNEGKLPNAIMLFGESHFLIERYASQLTKIDDANLLGLYHDEYHFDSAKAHLSQGSLFGGRNVLLIKHDKKVPKAELETLVGLCRKNPDNLFVYAYFGPDFKKSATAVFEAKQGGVNVRLFSPFFNEAKGIVMHEAQRLGLAMDPYAATHLLLSQNNDLALAVNELEKLRVLGRAVTAKEIDELVYGLAEVKLDQLMVNLLQKKEFRADLQRILESGEDEIRVVTALSGFVSQLYLFYVYIKLNGAADSAAILGYKLPGFVEKERAQLSIRFSQTAYEAMLTLLLETELRMKSSGSDKGALLLATLLKLQSML